jgi:hypothetical protein
MMPEWFNKPGHTLESSELIRCISLRAVQLPKMPEWFNKPERTLESSELIRYISLVEESTDGYIDVDANWELCECGNLNLVLEALRAGGWQTRSKYLYAGGGDDLTAVMVCSDPNRAMPEKFRGETAGEKR